MKKNIALAVVFLLAASFIVVDSGQANALNENEKNIVENIVKNALENNQNQIDNIRGLVENNQSQIENLQGQVGNLQTQLDSISSSQSDMKNTLQNINDYIQEQKQSNTGEQLYVLALTQDNMETLNFGMTSGLGTGIGGMMTGSGTGGLSISNISQNAIIAVVNNNFRVVPDAQMSVMIMSDNGPIIRNNYPLANGYTQFTSGTVSGSVSAEGYKTVSFFAKVGEATQQQTQGGGIEIEAASTLEKGKSNIIYAKKGGQTMDAKVIVTDPDADPKYRSFEGSSGSVSIIPKTESFTVTVEEGGKTLKEQTLYVRGGTESGSNTPIGTIAAVAIFAVAIFLLYRNKDLLEEKFGGPEESSEEHRL